MPSKDMPVDREARLRKGIAATIAFQPPGKIGKGIQFSVFGPVFTPDPVGAVS